MAEQTKIVSIEAIENIQQLKDNIKALKQEVDTLTVGSEQYNAKVVELASNQRALKLAMTGVYESMQDVAKASRQDTEALNATVQAAQNGTATYNQMSTALGALKAQIKDIPKYLSEQDQAINQINPAYQELSSKIQVLDGSLKSLDADNGVFTRNVGNYVGALQEWGGTMGQVQQVGSQLMSGMMSLVGVMSVLGVDTDKTKNSLQALVPVVALLNAAKGIGGLTKLLPKASDGTVKLSSAAKQATVATKQQAVATEELTVAEGAATAAGITLKAVLDSLGIGLIIAGVTALAGAVWGLVSGTAKANEEAEKFEKTQKELNERFEDEKEELENNNRLLEAQGVKANELIDKKIELIDKYRKEKEAIIAANNERLEEIEQHNWLQKLFRGELGLKKKLIEENKTLNEEVKEYNKEIKNLRTEQRVNDINNAKKASEDLAKTYEKDLTNGLSAATGAIKKARTELTSINLDFEEERKVIESAITATDKLIQKNRELFSQSKDTKTRNKLEEEYLKLLEKKDTLLKGIAASDYNRTETLNAYYGKEYEKQVLIQTEQLLYDQNKRNKYALQYENIMRNVLGLTETEIMASEDARVETENRLEVYKQMSKAIGDYIKNGAGLDLSESIKKAVVNGLDWEQMIKLSQTDAERLAKNIGEPLATAIGLYVKNEGNYKQALSDKAEQIVSGLKVKFEEALEKGDWGSAKFFRRKLFYSLQEALGEDYKEFQSLFDEFFNSLDMSISKAIAENPILGLDYGETNIISYLFGSIEDINEYFKALKETTADGIDNVNIIARERFSSIMNVYSSFLDSYGRSTAEALSSVADLWETSLKWKYKKLVESGKLTEAEAEKQAQNEFKTVKELQIGVAAISTAAAIVQALADPTVPNYYVKAANAIAAGIAGAAQIMTISMTDFGKPSVNMPQSQTSTPSYTQEPQGMYYSVGVNPMDYAEANAQTPVKVYVTDQDIVEGIDNYNNRKAEVTF